jgi:hypothetical protein
MQFLRNDAQFQQCRYSFTSHPNRSRFRLLPAEAFSKRRFSEAAHKLLDAGKLAMMVRVTSITLPTRVIKSVQKFVLGASCESPDVGSFAASADVRQWLAALGVCLPRSSESKFVFRPTIDAT